MLIVDFKVIVWENYTCIFRDFVYLVIGFFAFFNTNNNHFFFFFIFYFFFITNGEKDKKIKGHSLL